VILTPFNITEQCMKKWSDKLSSKLCLKYSETLKQNEITFKTCLLKYNYILLNSIYSIETISKK
jgi:hypothetical protein